MKAGIITTLVKKDMVLYFRNKLFFITTMGLIGVMAVIYFLMPNTLEGEYSIGIFAENEIPLIIMMRFEKEGVKVKQYSSLEVLKKEVESGKIRVGMVLTEENLKHFIAGVKTIITVYFPPHFPVELDNAFTDFISIEMNEIAQYMRGFTHNINVKEEVLGMTAREDKTNPRDKILPLFVMMILMADLMTLSILVVEEREKRTLHALLLTQVDVKSLFISKGITGIGLAFILSIVFLTITGNIFASPLLILLIVFLTAVMFTGIAFFIASVSKNMMSAIGVSTGIFMILVFPAFSILFPGLISTWIRIIPTYYLIMPLYQLIHFPNPTGIVWQGILILFGSSCVLLLLGSMFLRRSMR